jgi:small subunit ribosomal protein S20
LAKTSLSVLKRQRQNAKRRLLNYRRKKALKLGIKELRAADGKDATLKLLPAVQSKIDKATRKGLVHRNTASRLKSRLARETSEQE